MPALSAPLWIHILLHSTDYLLELVAAIWLLVTWRQRTDNSRLYLGSFFLFSFIGSVLAMWNLASEPESLFLPVLSPNPVLWTFPIFLLVVFYILEAANPEGISIRQMLRMFIPWAILVVPTWWICRKVNTPLYSLNDILFCFSCPDVWLRLLCIILFIPYGIYAYVMARRSTTRRPHLRQIGFVVMLMTFAFVGGSGLRLLTFDLLHILLYIVLGLLCLYAEYFSTRKDKQGDGRWKRDNGQWALEPIPSIEDIDTEVMGQKPLKERVRILMNEKRVWLRSDLTLDDMVKMAATNRTYLLSIIKEMGYKNFSEMINLHRIRYAMEEHAMYPEEPMLDILFRSGYRSRTSANRNLKTYGEASAQS